jgi:acylphosphatase
MDSVRAEIIVRGKMQKAGYRDHVQEVARSLNVNGHVENMKDGTVRIICEAKEDTLERFTQQINIKTDLVEVEKVEILKKEPATGQFEYFDIKYGSLEEETGERMVAAFKIAVMTRQEIKNMHGDMKYMHQDLKGSINSMHQDLKTSITSMHEDMKNMHQDLKGTITGMHQDLKGSINGMHEDLKSMHSDLKGSIDSMHQDMNCHFEEMAKRYDAISAELLKTREELKRAVDTLVELVRKFLEKSP